MLRVLWGGLPSGSLAGHDSGCFLVFKVKLRQLCLEDTHPTVNHHLPVVHGIAGLLRPADSVSLVAATAEEHALLGRTRVPWCGLIECRRLFYLLFNVRSELGFFLEAIRVDLRASIGRVSTIGAEQIALALALCHQVRVLTRVVVRLLGKLPRCVEVGLTNVLRRC